MQIELAKEMAKCLRGAAEMRVTHRLALDMGEQIEEEKEVTVLALELADLLENWG